jgi:flagellar motor switch/type III secretory pathway protein FliN
MKKLLFIVLVLIVCVAALGYWRGWLKVDKGSSTEVQIEPAKFKQDKDAFRMTVVDKTKGLKQKIASLWTKAESLTGDEKAHAKQELAELEKKHERLENQLKELESANAGEFESIKHDLASSLAEVEMKIGELMKKMAKGKDK